MTRSRVAVIGAGLAGTATAAALGRAGFPVDLIADAGTRRASSLPAGILCPHMASQVDPLTKVRRLGLRWTQAWLNQLQRQGLPTGLVAQGVLSLVDSDRSRRRRDRLPWYGRRSIRVRPGHAYQCTGVEPGESAILHNTGGCLVPDAFCSALLAAADDSIARLDGHVTAVLANGAWSLQDAYGGADRQYHTVIVAAGAGTLSLLPALRPMLDTARGQASAIAATEASRRQRVAVSGHGYVTPPEHGTHWVGATLQRGEQDVRPRAVDDEANRDRFRHLWPDTGEPTVVDHFVGVRVTTPDRLPVVDEIAPGLWVNTAHGSHGLSTAPLAGALLARALLGHRVPLLQRLRLGRPALERVRRRVG